MAFCSSCGAQIADGSSLCAACASRTAPAGPAPAAGSTGGMADNVAGMLAYVTIIPAIVFLVMEPYNRNRFVRFHAFQGLWLFVAWLLDDWVLEPITAQIPHFPIHGLVKAVLLFMSIFMMVKAAHNEAYSLPLFGELAERSVSEK